MVIAHTMYCSSKLFWSSNNQYLKNLCADKPEELLAECVITLQQCKVMMLHCLLHFNRNFQWLKLPGVYIDTIRQVLKFYSFVRMKQALHVSVTSPTQMHFFGFFFNAFRQAGPPQWIDCLTQWELGVKCLSQGHDDALPMRELNQRSVTFSSRVRRSTTKRLHPLNSAFNLN